MKQLILALACVTSLFGHAQNNIITKEKINEIDAYIQYFVDHNELQGTVALRENGENVYSKTFGESNTQVEDVQDRLYTIGSITKTFTAVLITKMAEEGTLQLNEPLSNFFPEIPHASDITIQQMLNHTSGLKDYVSRGDTAHFWLREPRTETEIINEIQSQGVAFAPGDSMSYSNSAYYLLGKVLEKKHDKPYHEILQDEIIQPLQLKHTMPLYPECNKDNLAASLEKKGESWVEMEEFYFPNAFSAGYIASTPSDLNAFFEALFHGKIISQKTLEEMLPKNDDWFGSGIMKVPFDEHIAYGHGGDTYGTHSVAGYNLEEKLGIAYIINGENYPTNDFAIGLLCILYDVDHELPNFNKFEPKPEALVAYSGTYGAADFPMKIEIQEANGELTAQAEGQSAFVLNPIAEHLFDFKKAGIEIEFVPKTSSLILKQAGMEFELKKI